MEISDPGERNYRCPPREYTQERMAATDKTRVTKPSPIVEDEQGQLVAKKGISREVVEELSKIKGEPDWMREKRIRSL
jgi:hypothetical protein